MNYVDERLKEEVDIIIDEINDLSEKMLEDMENKLSKPSVSELIDGPKANTEIEKRLLVLTMKLNVLRGFMGYE